MKADGPVRLGVFGAGGRLGRRVIECLPEHPGLKLVQAVGRDPPPGAFAECEVVIDVSLAAATAELLACLEGTAAALVTGVTGRDAAQNAALEARTEIAPVLFAANFSVGVAMLQRLVRAAAAALGPDFEAEVFEVHHRHKRDAPSGTALALARAAAEGAGHPWPAAAMTRQGPTGPRGEAEVGLAALRGGEVIGEHTVFFFGPSERIELTHRAADRSVFAHGALRAAAFLAGRPAGRYGMHDVLDAAASTP